MMLWLAAISASFVASISASPEPERAGLAAAFGKRQTFKNSSSSLVVDLGYEQYQGVVDTSTGLNTWKGIRYAAPPTGSLRWQAPQTPRVNRGKVLSADALPQRCPQATLSFLPPPQDLGFNYTGDEDCLFLSVYAPANAINLPVVIWIHGGGYAVGQGDADVKTIIVNDNNSFIAVVIQYRLGAFGFLSSDEVMREGVVNAGLLDQHFALQWVQNFIGLFGGDASQVTIGGESAGGGSVMLQAMAYGGTIGESLFKNVISASPYLPRQDGYKDFIPSETYYAFASAAGCFGSPALPQNNFSNSVFACLVNKDTATLQYANTRTPLLSRYAAFVFLPVTDGVFVQQLPSQQLLKKQVNGRAILVGHNANEGPLFTPQNIVTEDDFVKFLRNRFPLFTNDNISQILRHYPSTNASVSTTPKFATSGTSPPTAINESTFATGQQQRAENVYAESTFVCPSYWLADAFTGNDHKAYSYQYSVIGAEHGADLSALELVSAPTPNQAPAFNKAFQAIWGNFITGSNPSISASIANGPNSTLTTNPATDWPPWNVTRPYQMNLNESGGTPFETQAVGAANAGPITELWGPSLRNDIELVDAYAWEGGRGARCEFWRSVAEMVPS